MSNLSQFQKSNKYLMLALDHRTSFKKLMNPENQDSVLDEEVINLKAEIIHSVEDQLSGVLIDEIFGLKAYPQRSKPFLLPVEKSGYTDKVGEKMTEIEFSLEQLREYGADGAKLLLYYNPYLKSAEAQLETAKKFIDDCKANSFPSFLEIVTYEPDHEETIEEREKLVIETLKIFKSKQIIPDVFKLEYPGSALACQTITAVLEEIPWILLTRGDSFDHFTEQLDEASIRGCQGFLAGRALWQEVCIMQGEDKENFLKNTLPERFKKVASIVSN